jgi:hypothetical protein
MALMLDYRTAQAASQMSGVNCQLAFGLFHGVAVHGLFGPAISDVAAAGLPNPCDKSHGQVRFFAMRLPYVGEGILAAGRYRNPRAGTPMRVAGGEILRTVNDQKPESRQRNHCFFTSR